MRFSKVIVRRFGHYEVAEKEYHDCTVKQAIAWFNRMNMEDFGPAVLVSADGHGLLY